MITITLNKIREHHPCKEGWEMLLKHLGKVQADDEEFPLSVVLDANGLNGALWCARCLPEHEREWRLFVVWCARQVQHLMKDQRSLDALDVAERFANGVASTEELSVAGTAAAWAAGTAAAWAAGAAAAGAAAAEAAWAAAFTAARANQEIELRRIIG